MPDQRIKQIKRASWIAIVLNALLAAFKVASGFIAGSLSVVADGVDSSADVVISIITLSVAFIINKPPNLKFPYGYAKAEANATVVVAFVLFFAGAQLAVSSVTRMFNHSVIEIPGNLALIAIVVSISGKIFLSWYQHHVGKKIQSSLLLANAKNMQGDVVISTSVLVGLLLTYYFKIAILDSIVSFLVSIWILWLAVKIFIETNMELMDGNIERAIYEQVFDIVEKVPGVHNPHRMRIRRAGNKLMINIDIELDGKMSLKNAHDISHKIEKKIREELKYDIFDVIIHSEPIGHHIIEQNIGISKETLHDETDKDNGKNGMK